MMKHKKWFMVAAGLLIPVAVIIATVINYARLEGMLQDRLEADLANGTQLSSGEINGMYGKAAGAYIWSIDGERYGMRVYSFGDTRYKIVKRIERREVIYVEVVSDYRTSWPDWKIYVYDNELYKKVVQSSSFILQVNPE